MRKLDYSRQFVLDFGSVSSKFNRCSLIDEIFIRYEIDRSFIVIISLSLSLFTILPLPQSPSIKIFIVPPSKQRSIILPRATPSKELFERKGREGKKEEKEQEEEKGEGGRGTERKGEISRRKIRGEHVKEGKNISRRVVPPPSPPPCRSSRSGASNGEKRKGRGGREGGEVGEKDEAEWSHRATKA